MKVTHYNSTARHLGFPSIEAYIRKRYVEERWSIEAMVDETDIGQHSMRNLLRTFGIKKPKVDIPLDYDDARSLGVDAIAYKLGIPRSTAWRWKQQVIARHAALEEASATGAPDAGAE